MAVGNWISNLFHSDGARGLSGGGAGAVAEDRANSYYNYRLWRHAAQGDLVADPSLLWRSTSQGRIVGLEAHLQAERGEGVASFTDVLVVLSHADYERAFDENAQGTDWVHRATRDLLRAFDRFCAEGFTRRFGHRFLGFKFVCDGAEEMGGLSYGLQVGEFVTGVLPNLYTGPVVGSAPVIGIHVNLPGVWEGYREVGRLYNDQILFTLGNHWLDNFGHPALGDAAIYRLQQQPDGRPVHILNPDLQDRLQLTTTAQEGASVLTVSTTAGKAIAHLVLASIEERIEDEPTKDAGEAPQYSVPPPMMVDDATPRRRGLPRGIGAGAKTILPEGLERRIFTFQERGALLQKVHFSAYMLGYDVYVGRHGSLGTDVDDIAAVFEVRQDGVSLVARSYGVMVDTNPLAPGDALVIRGDRQIECAGQRLEFRDLRDVDVDGWPYVGEIRRPASSTYMMWGEVYRVGRSRECRVVLPDEPRNGNIHWKPEVGDGETIRARRGEIPKARFYTDSIMVGSEHGEIDLSGDEPRIRAIHRDCFAFLRRGGEILPLYPNRTSDGSHERVAHPGDEVLIGNCVFYVGYMPLGMSVPPEPAPQIGAAVEDPPAPSGLGKPGVPPEPLRVPRPTRDSLVGEDTSTRRDLSEVKVSFDEEEEESPTELGGPGRFEDGEFELPRYAEESGEESGTSESMGDGEGETVPVFETFPPPDFDDASDESPVIPLSAPVARPPNPPSAEGAVAPDDEPTVSVSGSASDDAFEEASSTDVRVVDDADAQFELSRRMLVVQIGWMVKGELVCGNHDAADLVVPENRMVEDQHFEPRNYFRVKVRGRRGDLEVLTPSEVLIDEADSRAMVYDGLDQRMIDIVRRDDQGEEDFGVRMTLESDRSLPDPRARLLRIDIEDALTAALFTKGLPADTARTVSLSGLSAVFHHRGEIVEISDYLEAYRLEGGGYRPFFVQRDGGRFQTVPEDGSMLVLKGGDRLLSGQAVFELKAQ